MKWTPFEHDGKTYDLSHLHPFHLVLTRPATGKLTEESFSFDVIFSHHCFTKTIKDGDDPALKYGDSREDRTFCFARYQLSHQLPNIVREIHQKRCSHTRHGNFFFVELVNEEGESPRLSRTPSAVERLSLC